MPHTQGPWIVCIPGMKLGGAPINGPHLIETRAGLDIGTARNKEDALLMRAAPDLLEALTAIVKDLEAELSHGGLLPTSHEHLANAHAAIARAEGRA